MTHAELVQKIVEKFPIIGEEATLGLVEGLTDAQLEKLLDAPPGVLGSSLGSGLVRLVQRADRRVIPTAVAFERSEKPTSHSRRMLLAWPQMLFKPQGLWLWGATGETLIYEFKVGNQSCFKLSHVPLPGLFFEAGMSFEEFEKTLLEDPRDGWTHWLLKDLPAAAEHQRISAVTAEVGNTITLDVSGPLTHAVLWGQSVE